MNRIDRLIDKARPDMTVQDRLERDNPFMGKSFRELLDMENNGTAPPNDAAHELSRGKFMYALIDAFRRRGKEDEAAADGDAVGGPPSTGPSIDGGI